MLAARLRTRETPLAGISREEADAHFGLLAAVVPLDNSTSSAVTQELLGWRPAHPRLIADLEEGHFDHPGA